MRTDLQDLSSVMKEYCFHFEQIQENDSEIFGPDIIRVSQIELLERRGESKILSDLHQFRQTPIYNIFQKRAEYLGLKISDTATLYLSSLFKSPGDIVMYLSYISYKVYEEAKKQKMPIQLDIIKISKILKCKRLPKDDTKILKLWDGQKVPLEKRRGFMSDNYLDMLSQKTLTLILGNKSEDR